MHAHTHIHANTFSTKEIQFPPYSMGSALGERLLLPGAISFLYDLASFWRGFIVDGSAQKVTKIAPL